MKKLTNSQLINALYKWADNPDDFKLIRYINSLGYTANELSALARNNIKIARAADLCIESNYEKMVERISAGYYNNELAEFIFITLNHFLFPNREAPPYSAAEQKKLKKKQLKEKYKSSLINSQNNDDFNNNSTNKEE